MDAGSPSTPRTPKGRRSRRQLVGKEALASEALRVAVGWIEAVLKASQRSGTARDAGIHDARVGLKRLRALMRLLRPGLEPSIYQRENTAFRDIGRALSAARDKTALLKAFERLARNTNAPDKLATEKASIRRWANKRLEQANPAPANVSEPLLAAKQRAAEWAPTLSGWRLVAEGLAQTYEKARDKRPAAKDGFDASVFHEWRKRTKHYFYQLELLRELLPESFKAETKQIKTLADTLGRINDLDLLKEALETARLRPHQREQLLAAGAQLEKKLIKKALRLGKDVYRRKPANIENIAKKALRKAP